LEIGLSGVPGERSAPRTSQTTPTRIGTTANVISEMFATTL